VVTPVTAGSKRMRRCGTWLAIFRRYCFRSDRWDALHDSTGDHALNARHNQPDQHRIAPTEHRSASRLNRPFAFGILTPRGPLDKAALWARFTGWKNQLPVQR
jgi:hypothetical protein